jgi:hypothetical protein
VNEAESQIVVDTEMAFLMSRDRQDADSFRSYLHPSFYEVDDFGIKRTYDRAMDGPGADAKDHLPATGDVTVTYLHENIALVSYSLQTSKRPSIVSSTWVKINDNWWIIHRQITPILKSLGDSNKLTYEDGTELVKSQRLLTETLVRKDISSFTPLYLEMEKAAPQAIDFYLQSVRNGSMTIFGEDLKADIENLSEEQARQHVSERIMATQYRAALKKAKPSFSLGYQNKLLSEAQRYLDLEVPEFAVLFYALYFEHWLNRMLRIGCQQLGWTDEITNDFIKDSKIKPKTAKDWRTVFGRELPDELRDTIRSVSELRNEFAHYKHVPQYEDSEDKTQAKLHTALKRIPRSIELTNEVESQFFYAAKAT